MLYSMKIKSIEFNGVTKQDAYLKGCKKLAKFIASPKYDNITVKVEKGSETSFIFTLFASIDIGKEVSQYCKMCKEFHCSFYVNEEYNCARCNLKNCMQRIKGKAGVSKLYYKHIIKKE